MKGKWEVGEGKQDRNRFKFLFICYKIDFKLLAASTKRGQLTIHSFYNTVNKLTRIKMIAIGSKDFHVVIGNLES